MNKTPTKFQNAHKIPPSLRLRTDGRTHFNSLLRHEKQLKKSPYREIIY